MVTLQEQLSGLNLFESIILVKDMIIGGINAIIHGFSSDNPVAIVALLSILIGIGIKRWKKMKWLEAIIMTILIYGFLRFAGIGN